MLEDIAARLLALGTAGPGKPVYAAHKPNEPDTCIALFEYAGLAPQVVLDGSKGIKLERPRLNVWVRARDYATGRALAHDVLKALGTVGNEVINGAKYVSITALQSPEHMGRDENGRDEFVTNFQIIRESE